VLRSDGKEYPFVFALWIWYDKTIKCRVGMARQVPADGMLPPDEEAKASRFHARIRCHKKELLSLWQTPQDEE